MSSKQRLELTWIGKENRPRLEPRILLEDPEKSYHARQRVTGNDIFDNRLIFGDNLLALKALEQEFAGRIKCVFIDPPYNTGSAFAHYDDGVEHSLWLSLMRDRIELIQRLLSNDGSLWITIDDNEAHYLKVLCDEVFSRSNFVANAVWQKKYARQNDAKWFSTSHDHIFVFAKDKNSWKPREIERNATQLSGYSNPDNDPRGLWQSVVYTCAKTREERPNLYYPIIHPRTGEEILPNPSRVWGYDQARHLLHVAEGRIWWGANQEKNKPRLKSFLEKVGSGMVPDTLWLRADVGDNQDAKREAMAFNATDTFTTPKPEALLRRILDISTFPGELVLDSFGGSGTTGAVAHKMGRRWIMVELGDHAHTHIIPRLKKVIDGQDPGGVTESTGWKGGGGFRYFHIAPSLLDKDRFGNLIISKQYNAAMLAEAMCKIMGFTYAPSDELYWQQGHSTENDFIYITTQTLTREQLAKLSDEVGDHRSLLICCAAFRSKADAFPNLTIKKIPSSVLAKCEWGHDDYSLNVANLPKAAPPVEPPPADPSQPLTPKQVRRRVAQPNLFAADSNGGVA
jgi:adenine-specific DNA-methyltransferase